MTLEQLISRTIEIADKRNLAKRNPIPVTYPTESIGELIIVVSELEPNNATLPLNVSWICMDSTSHRYMKMFRRAAISPYYGLNHTWYELGSLEELLEQEQYWDTSGALSLGEAEVPEVGAATTAVRGLFQLNSAQVGEEVPTVVSDEDERMSDKRTPLPHEHAVLPAKEFLASSGTVEATVQVYTATAPLAGQVLRITSQEDATTFIGVWDWPRASDIAYSGPTFDNLVINGPAGDQLDETVPFKFSANALFSDASSVEVPATWSIIGGGQYASIGAASGTLQTLDVDEDVVIRVQATYTHPESKVTRSSYIDVTIIDNTVYIEILGITVNGPTNVNENTQAVYTVTATFSDGTSTGVTPTTFVSSNSGAGTFDGATGVLSVPDLNTNVETVISASYTFNGKTVTDSLDVSCTDNTIYPESATIIGADTLDEGTTSNYTLRVTYTDGTISDLADANWASDNEDAATIDPSSGTLTAVTETTVDLSTTITAFVSISGRTVNAEKVVYIRDGDIYPQTAVINGPSAVMESSNAQYSFEVTWTDGSVTTVQVADWAVDNEAVGVISATTGVLTSTEQSSEVTTNVTASYTKNGITLNATKAIRVTDETIYVASARIIGDGTMDENDTQTLLFEVTYEDGTKANKVIGNWATIDGDVATIGATTGVLVSAPDVNGNVSTNVTGSFTENGKTVSASFEVTVIDTTEYITKVTINGRSDVEENTTTPYSYTVFYSTGRSANDVDPKSVEVLDEAGNVSSIATYSLAADTLTSLEVSQDTNIRLRFTFEDATEDFIVTKVITVLDVKPVVTAIHIADPEGTIIPAGNRITIDENTTYQFTALGVLSDGSTYLMEPSEVEWLFNASIVDIDETGLMTGNSIDVWTEQMSKSVSVTLRAINDSSKTDTISVTVRDTEDYQVSYDIVGPSSIPENATRSFSVDTRRKSGAVENGNAYRWFVVPTGYAYATVDGDGNVTTTEVPSNSSFILRAMVESYTSTTGYVATEKTITLTNVVATPESATLSIDKTPLPENETGQLTFQVTWSDGTTTEENPNYIVADPSYLSINVSGVVTPAENTTDSDLTTNVTGSFTSGGITVQGSTDVTISNYINRPISIEVKGPLEVPETNQTTRYTAEVTWRDGSVTDETDNVTWRLGETSKATIDPVTGELHPKDNPADYDVAVFAKFVDSETSVSVEDYLMIKVIDETVYVSEVFIKGPNELEAATNGVANEYTYEIWIRFTDGSEALADDDTYLDARPKLLGDILADTANDSVWTRDMGAFIDDRTMRTNPDMSDNGTGIRYGKVSGNYVLDGQSTSISFPVEITVPEVMVEPTLTISGASTVNSNSTQTYTAEYLASDGTTSNVTPTWSVDDTTYASINASGVLTTTNALTETDIVVSATYVDGSTTVTDTFNVTIAQGVVLQSIAVSGATSMEENTSEQYTVTATYSDSSTADVTNSATYSVNNASAGAFNSSTKGLFDAAEVSADTTATLTFTYVEDGISRGTTQSITVTDVAVVEPTGNSNPRWGVAMFNGGASFTGGPEGEKDINYDIPYEQWDGPQDFADKVMTNILETGTADTTLVVTMGSAMYGYFAHRKADASYARFTDTAIDFESAWGGASWTPEGEIGDNFDPVEVMYDCHDGNGPQPWLFYRTDWDSNGTITYELKFDDPV